jgi:hypothetical protein
VAGKNFEQVYANFEDGFARPFAEYANACFRRHEFIASFPGLTNILILAGDVRQARKIDIGLQQTFGVEPTTNKNSSSEWNNNDETGENGEGDSADDGVQHSPQGWNSEDETIQNDGDGSTGEAGNPLPPIPTIERPLHSALSADTSSGAPKLAETAVSSQKTPELGK